MEIDRQNPRFVFRENFVPIEVISFYKINVLDLAMIILVNQMDKVYYMHKIKWMCLVDNFKMRNKISIFQFNVHMLHTFILYSTSLLSFSLSY